MTERTNLSILNTGRFLCPACPARFDVVGDKKRHIRDEHPKKK